jgi:Tol biopolymer transport system component
MITQAYARFLLLLVCAPAMLLHLTARSQSVHPEIFAPGIISGPLHEAAPAFTPDGKTVYYHCAGGALQGTILASHLQKDVWSKPEVAPWSGEWSDIEPAMSPDGSYLIFSSNRPAVPGGKPLDGYWSGQAYPHSGGNLWRVDRKNGQFGEPYRLPDIINGGSSIFSPAIAADGSLYFMRPLADTGRFHIYRAAWRHGQYGQPELVPFSAPGNFGDVDPAVAPDESFLVFSSNRPPAVKNQLFIVYRKDGRWGEPLLLSDTINRPPASNVEARLSPDLRTLYFSSGYAPAVHYPSSRDNTGKMLEQSLWFNGNTNIWCVPIGSLIRN